MRKLHCIATGPGALRAYEIDARVEQTENVVFAGAQAACARIQLSGEPGPEVLARIREGCEDVFSVGLSRL